MSMPYTSASGINKRPIEAGLYTGGKKKKKNVFFDLLFVFFVGVCFVVFIFFVCF